MRNYLRSNAPFAYGGNDEKKFKINDIEGFNFIGGSDDCPSGSYFIFTCKSGF